MECQKQTAFEIDGLRFDCLRLDMLVEGCVVVELKSIERLAPIHWKQLLTYLRLLDLPVGLLINFGEMKLKDGLHRVSNPRRLIIQPMRGPNASSLDDV